MKKIVVFFSIILAIISCNKQQEPINTIKELRFNIQVNHTADTKAVKQDFYAGDKVYVFFEDCNAASWVSLTKQSNGSWKAEESPFETDFSNISDGKKMYAVYIPDWEPDNKSATEFFFTSHYYYETAETTYSLETEDEVTTLSGTLNLSLPEGFVQFYIDKSGSDYFESNRYRMAIQGVIPEGIAGFDGKGFIVKAHGDYGQPMWGYKYDVSGNEDASDGQGIIFSGKIDDSWSDSKNIHRLIFFDTNDRAKSAVLSGKTLESHDAIKFRPETVSSWNYAVSVPDPEDVIDLNDGSGIKWAPYNVGASTSCGRDSKYDDVGFLFAFGEIVPYVPSAYSEDYPNWNFKRNDNPTDFMDYYNGDTDWMEEDVDYLDFSVDPACAFWGADWRMPYWSEIKYLCFEGGTNGGNIIGAIDLVTDCYKVGNVYIPLIRNQNWTSILQRDWFNDGVGPKGNFYAIYIERDNFYFPDMSEPYIPMPIRPVYDPK